MCATSLQYVAASVLNTGVRPLNRTYVNDTSAKKHVCEIIFCAEVVSSRSHRSSPFHRAQLRWSRSYTASLLSCQPDSIICDAHANGIGKGSVSHAVLDGYNIILFCHSLETWIVP
jgi:hypothetical protein